MKERAVKKWHDESKLAVRVKNYTRRSKKRQRRNSTNFISNSTEKIHSSAHAHVYSRSIRSFHLNRKKTVHISLILTIVKIRFRRIISSVSVQRIKVARLRTSNEISFCLQSVRARAHTFKHIIHFNALFVSSGHEIVLFRVFPVKSLIQPNRNDKPQRKMTKMSAKTKVFKWPTTA